MHLYRCHWGISPFFWKWLFGFGASLQNPEFASCWQFAFIHKMQLLMLRVGCHVHLATPWATRSCHATVRVRNAERNCINPAVWGRLVHFWNSSFPSDSIFFFFGWLSAGDASLLQFHLIMVHLFTPSGWNLYHNFKDNVILKTAWFFNCQ